MIVIFKNDEIYAVDKQLLQDLNTDLEHLSTVLSSIKLSLSYLENKKIIIQNKSFSVNEIDILSIDNLKVFDLKQETTIKNFEENLIPIEEYTLKEHTSNEELTLNLENELLKEPETLQVSVEETLSHKEETPQFDLNLKEPEIHHSIEEISPQIEKESQFDLNLKEPSENLEVQYQTPEENENIQPLEENVIKINFENDYDEISKILSMNKEEIQNLIQEDLEKASNDLGIDINTLQTFTDDLIKQINENKNKFYEAIQKHDYKKLHELAHSLKGAALNLRLSNIALILKYIDEKSKAKENIDTIKYLVDKFYNFINYIKPQSNQKIKETNVKITPEIKKLIIKTIKNYTATQNHKKLKKDLQYIEKILGIKIDSIEELQNIIKGI